MTNLEQQLAKVIEKSISLAEKTGEFAIEQAPDLVYQFIMWHIVEHSFMFILLLSVNLIWIPLTREKVVDCIDDYGNELYIIPAAISIICFIFAMLHLLTLIQIIVAPKIYLIEYFINKI